MPSIGRDLLRVMYEGKKSHTFLDEWYKKLLLEDFQSLREQPSNPDLVASILTPVMESQIQFMLKEVSIRHLDFSMRHFFGF